MKRHDRHLAIVLVILALGVTGLSWWFSRDHSLSLPHNISRNPGPVTGRMSLVLGNKISLNDATAFDLTALPGIGPEKARSIVEWRERKGPFKKIEQLEQIKGIGKGTLKKLQEYLFIQ